MINIGSKVYVHITGLKNGSVPVEQHRINLKKCSITDGYGLQEVLLIQGTLLKLEFQALLVLLKSTRQSTIFQTTKQPSNEHQQKLYDHQELLELVAIQVLCFHFKVMTLFKFR